MVLWVESGYGPQDLNPWKSPLFSLYCFQNPGAKVRGGRSDADYLTLRCNKQLLGNCQLINKQMSKIILPKFPGT